MFPNLEHLNLENCESPKLFIILVKVGPKSIRQASYDYLVFFPLRNVCLKLAIEWNVLNYNFYSRHVCFYSKYYRMYDDRKSWATKR